jgi:hypothetical protein
VWIVANAKDNGSNKYPGKPSSQLAKGNRPNYLDIVGASKAMVDAAGIGERESDDAACIESWQGARKSIGGRSASGITGELAKSSELGCRQSGTKSAGEQRGFDAAKCCNEGLADADQPGREEYPRIGCDDATQCKATVGSRWPSRRGQSQHDWEAPRIQNVEFGVGCAVDGRADRVRHRANRSLLRILGNAWVYPIAEIIFRWIAAQKTNLAEGRRNQTKGKRT